MRFATNDGLLSRYLILSLYIPALVLALGQGIITPAMPVYIKSFDIGFAEASLVFILYQVGALAATFPTGLLMDRIGRKPVLMAGPILTALSMVMTVAVGSYTDLLAWRFVAGAAQELWMQSRLAIITDSAGASSRGRQVTWMFGIQRVGTLAGPALGGVLASVWDVRIPFLVYAALLMIIVVPAFLAIGETAPAKTATAPADEGGIKLPEAPSLLRYLLTLQIMTFFVVQVLSTICRGAQDLTFNLYAVYAYDAGPAVIGWLSAISGAVTLPLPFITGYSMDRWGRKRVIVPGFALFAVALVFVAATAYGQWAFWLFVLGYVLAQLSQTITFGTMQVLGTDMAPEQARGAYFGIWRTISQAAALAAPGLFAVVAEGLGYGSAFLMLAAFSGAVAVLVGWLMKETVAVRSAQSGDAVGRG